MTLPASGTISIRSINTERGAVATASLSLSWVRSVTKGATTPFGLNQLRSKTYFKSNALGNCNNGNCNQIYGSVNCGDGYGGQGNCAVAGVNCSNCDGAAYFQANCNCACTYNCSVTGVILLNCAPVNCDCNCGNGA